VLDLKLISQSFVRIDDDMAERPQRF